MSNAKRRHRPGENQSIQAMVRRDLEERERLGKERYGTALYPHNGRNALQDAYEEALDLACYLKQALVEQGEWRRLSGAVRMKITSVKRGE